MATYTVDYLNGSNGNPGTSGSPWKTIEKFLLTASNGDTCKVVGSNAAGQYFYELSLSTSLTNITIEAADGSSPVISTADPYTTWVATGGTSNVYQTAYTNTTVVAVWNGTTSLTSTASVAACDALTNSYFFDNPGDLLHVNIGGAAPTLIHANRNTATFCTFNGNNTTLRNLTFQWCAQTVQMVGNDATMSLCTTRYCRSASTGSALLRFDGARPVINNCGFTMIGTYGHCIRFSSTCSASNINNCVLDLDSVTAGEGMHWQGGTGHVAVDNRVTGGLEACYRSTNATVTLTRCVGINTQRATFYGDSGSVMYCLRCRAYLTRNTNTIETYGFIADEDTAPANAYWYHCVVAWLERNTRPPVNPSGAFGINTSGTVTFYNCIAYESYRGYVDLGSFAATIVEGYNTAYGNNATAFSGFVPAATDNQVNPQFDDAPNDDFAVSPPSPMVDTGLYIPGINDGYSGSAPDRGYLEYVIPEPGEGIGAGIIVEVRAKGGVD